MNDWSTNLVIALLVCVVAGMAYALVSDVLSWGVMQ